MKLYVIQHRRKLSATVDAGGIRSAYEWTDELNAGYPALHPSPYDSLAPVKLKADKYRESNPGYEYRIVLRTYALEGEEVVRDA